MIETNAFTASSGEKQVRILESCLAPSCVPWHTASIEFSCERGPQTCLCPPRSVSNVSCLHLTILHRDNLVDSFRMYPCNPFTSGGQHKIFWRKSSVDIIPESSSSFQDLIILKRDCLVLGLQSLQLHSTGHSLRVVHEEPSESLQPVLVDLRSTT